MAITIKLTAENIEYIKQHIHIRQSADLIYDIKEIKPCKEKPYYEIERSEKVDEEYFSEHFYDDLDRMANLDTWDDVVEYIITNYLEEEIDEEEEKESPMQSDERVKEWEHSG